MIDEYPILAVAAAFAEGQTVMRGVGELRVKESDRLAAIAGGLRACGVEVQVEGDDLIIQGCAGSPPGGAEVRSCGDHRIAMAFLILGCGAQREVRVDDCDMIDTSFPGFARLMNRIGARISPA
jgi:3-phosphoshikimate 1-carboxyvinyltransferase